MLYNLSPATKVKLYNSYCIPKTTYGLGLEKINDSLLRKLEMMQNKEHRLGSYNNRKTKAVIENIRF